MINTLEKKMINVIIPMAGMGSRFVDKGYSKPKPFIEFRNKPMVEHVLENLKIPNAQYFLIARKEHVDIEYKAVKNIEKNYKAQFIVIDKLTEGTACSVLYARKFINNNTPLLIANSDQIIDVDINRFVDDCYDRNLDGSILTFIDKERNSKWSFAKIDKNRFVTEVKEKVPISEYATVGIYLFSKGYDFVNGAIDMIVNNDRVNNEFYTCPVYNYLIKEKKKIGVFNISQEEMHGIGTPEDLAKYIRST